MELFSVLVTRIRFKDGTGSKIRPALVVKFDNQTVRTYKITSQYEDKSPKIKKHYFEVMDWQQANLKKASWIDTISYYDIDVDAAEYRIIGKLSARDVDRLITFLEEKEL